MRKKYKKEITTEDAIKKLEESTQRAIANRENGDFWAFVAMPIEHAQKLLHLVKE